MTYGMAAGLIVLILMATVFALLPHPVLHPSYSELQTFSSYGELEDFLETNMERAKNLQIERVVPLLRGGEAELLSPETLAAPEHSTTNIQVAGVDEADIVKTDGEYLYVMAGSQLHILKAHPPENSSLLSSVSLNQTYRSQIYLKDDKLAVLGNSYHPIRILEAASRPAPYGESFLQVYDISDRSHPVLTRTLTVNGSLTGSRRIGDYIYMVTTQPATRNGENQTSLEVLLPTISSGTLSTPVDPTQIRYVNTSDLFYHFTTVIAVNILDDAQAVTYETFLTGATSHMYVSLTNLYLTVLNTNDWLRPNGVQETLIFRVKLEEESMACEAEGAVPGYVLNQFSMDQHNDHFRIATTKWSNSGSRNNIYVLNLNLSLMGYLEDLAPDERIYSARFMEDRCYLVTFRQVDPFFVIDLTSPAEPAVLGYLKIPGFSGYLHPYDQEHIIGVGSQEGKAKLSLFDVSNVTKPLETAKYLVPGLWSDTPVLRDHKAFLFDRPRQLLALPISTKQRKQVDRFPWQGAYIFNLSLEQGFHLQGNITHQDNGTRFDAGLQVERILYIQDTLYTLSEKKVKMNNLGDLTVTREIELP